MTNLKSIHLLILSGFMLGFTPITKALNTDSLFTIWADTSQTVEERCNALYEISWDLLWTDPDSSRKLAHSFGELARESGEWKLEGKAYNTIGVTYYLQGDYLNAEDA